LRPPNAGSSLNWRLRRANGKVSCAQAWVCGSRRSRRDSRPLYKGCLVFNPEFAPEKCVHDGGQPTFCYANRFPDALGPAKGKVSRRPGNECWIRLRTSWRHHAPGAADDSQRDEDRQDRIGRHPAREDDDGCGHQRGNRSQQIAPSHGASRPAC